MKFILNGTEQGQISVNGSGCNYESISDYRLKSNIVDIDSAIDTVKLLQPRKYTMNGVNDQIGFVAHELQDVVPQAVSGVKDAVPRQLVLLLIMMVVN